VGRFFWDILYMYDVVVKSPRSLSHLLMTFLFCFLSRHVNCRCCQLSSTLARLSHISVQLCLQHHVHYTSRDPSPMSETRLSYRLTLSGHSTCKAQHRLSQVNFCLNKRRKTSSSAIAEGPRDVLSQLKSCQLLHNCTKNHIWLEG